MPKKKKKNTKNQLKFYFTRKGNVTTFFHCDYVDCAGVKSPPCQKESSLSEVPFLTRVSIFISSICHHIRQFPEDSRSQRQSSTCYSRTLYPQGVTVSNSDHLQVRKKTQPISLGFTSLCVQSSLERWMVRDREAHSLRQTLKKTSKTV